MLKFRDYEAKKFDSKSEAQDAREQYFIDHNNTFKEKDENE